MLTIHFKSSGLSDTAKLKNILLYSTALFGSKITTPSIVVAGTKGKGSTCILADSILRKCGLNVGLFTSPHLVSPRERIKLNGKCIPAEDYITTYKKVNQKLSQAHLHDPPFFALNTLIAAQYFLDKNVDALVIECGIGSRFDWTQIFDPSVSVVTHLEYDHTEMLGKTPESIAWNKAGVFTPQSICYTAPQNPDFGRPLLEISEKEHCKPTTVPPIWDWETGLLGPTRAENTALGAAAAKSLAQKLKIKDFILRKAVIEGAKSATIHGRYQTLFDKNDQKWLLDGAHTHDSLKYCLRWYNENVMEMNRSQLYSNDLQKSQEKQSSIKKILKKHHQYLISKTPLKQIKKVRSNQNKASLNNKKIEKSTKDVLICATTKNRDPNQLFKPFLKKNWADVIYVSGYNNNNLFKNVTNIENLKDALKAAKRLKPRQILVTGSLHLVGDTLKELEWTPEESK